MYKLLIINLVAIQFMCGAKPIQFKEALIDGEFVVTPQENRLRNQIEKYLNFLALENLRYLDTLGEITGVQEKQSLKTAN